MLKKFKINIYSALLYRLLLAALMLQIGRIIFYALNVSLFVDTDLWSLPSLMVGGVAFDLTALLYINSLFILMQLLPVPITAKARYQKVSKYVFVITNALGVALNLGDTIYYRFTLRRSTALVVNEFSGEDNLWALFGRFAYDYWYMIVLFCAVVALLVWLYDRVEVKPLKLSTPWYIALSTTALAVGIALFIGGVRGGFKHSTRPITISNATQYVNHLGEEAIVLNTPFSLFRTLKSRPLPQYHDFGKRQLDSLSNPIHTPPSGRVMQRRNVVVIIVESLGRQYIGSYNKGTQIADFKSYTPFLDSLVEVSQCVRYGFASGKKSIDALPSTLCSIPSLTSPFVLSPYSADNIESLPDHLRRKGYTTSFFHGAPDGSMGLLAFSRKIGIERYYGKEGYDAWRTDNNDFDEMWGIWDDKFLEYMSYELSQQPQPFFASLFTLTSHHPFRVPDQYADRFDKGTVPMHQVIGYTDMALRNFFERSSHEEWFRNTIFVITGDHTNQSAYSEYNNAAGYFAVPLIFYDPQLPEGKMVDRAGSQMDIYPTIMEMLGYDQPYFSFGKDLFGNDRSADLTVNYNNDTYNFYTGDYMFQYDGRKILAVYDFKRDQTLQHNLANTDSLDTKPLLRAARAFCQQFNSSIAFDRMRVDTFREGQK